MSVESVNASNAAASAVQTATTQQTAAQQASSAAQQASSAAQQASSAAKINSEAVDTQAAPSESVQASQKMSAEEVQVVLDKMNEFMGSGQHNLNFSIDKDTDDMIVKVMDTETKEVIRQFPSEETLKLAKHIEGMLGLILNEQA